MQLQDPQILVIISQHITGKETPLQKEEFLNWLNESDNNKTFFRKIKKTLEDTKEPTISFRKRFTKEYLNETIIRKTIGNFIGFVVAMAVTNMSSHYVLEKKSLKNLFGLTKRKQVVVNDIPEWLQYGLSIIIGFIVLEYINHILQTKKHIYIWNYIKNIHKIIRAKPIS